MINLIERRWLIVPLILVMILLCTQTESFAQTEDMPCSESFYISHTFTNGAKWEMCYEERTNESIVYHDIYYTTAHGLRRKVLGQMNLAQIHVPYDDDSNRYNDISDFGLGGVKIPTVENRSDNAWSITLSAAECENGDLHQIGTRNVICKQAHRHGYAWKDYTDPHFRLAESMTLFNISRVQRYFYIMEYEFHDDGRIAPSVSATGLLQAYLYSNNPRWDNPGDYSWLLDQINPGGIILDRFGTNHTHSYWWRLDFDLGGPENDVFEEIEFIPETNGNYFRRKMSITTFTTETARTVSPETFRTWRVKDTVITNADGHAISYEIETNPKHLHRGLEEFTQNDIYVTNAQLCERFISNNTFYDPKKGPSGRGVITDTVTTYELDECATYSVDEFVDGEELTDAVVWYGATFHHLVRDEDNQHMTPHKEGFHLVPRDWTKDNPVDMEPLPDAPPNALTLSEVAEGSRAPMEGLNTSLFLVAISFMFVVGTVIARRKTR